MFALQISLFLPARCLGGNSFVVVAIHDRLTQMSQHMGAEGQLGWAWLCVLWSDNESYSSVRPVPLEGHKARRRPTTAQHIPSYLQGCGAG